MRQEQPLFDIVQGSCEANLTQDNLTISSKHYLFKVETRRGSRADIPTFGVLGDDIDPRSPRTPSRWAREVQLHATMMLVIGRLGPDGDSVSRRNSSRNSHASYASNASNTSSFLSSSTSSSTSSLTILTAFDRLLRSSLAPFLRNSGALGRDLKVKKCSSGFSFYLQHHHQPQLYLSQ